MENEMICLRDKIGEFLCEFAKQDNRIYVIDSDLAKSTKTLQFEKEFPNEVKAQKLGQGIIKVINSKSLIDFARQWFNKKDHQFGNAVD